MGRAGAPACPRPPHVPMLTSLQVTGRPCGGCSGLRESCSLRRVPVSPCPRVGHPAGAPGPAPAPAACSGDEAAPQQPCSDFNLSTFFTRLSARALVTSLTADRISAPGSPAAGVAGRQASKHSRPAAPGPLRPPLQPPPPPARWPVDGTGSAAPWALVPGSGPSSPGDRPRVRLSSVRGHCPLWPCFPRVASAHTLRWHRFPSCLPCGPPTGRCGYAWLPVHRGPLHPLPRDWGAGRDPRWGASGGAGSLQSQEPHSPVRPTWRQAGTW